ncbi:MAG: AAA family ATPase [Thermodesulfobacteriota bacterium]|nr:AAA family ATPase [Thermodesulfobacteriota bacterium]
MITKISMNNIASYKSLATLETDKKVNLVYGLNGTGKSTLSSFLYDKNNSDFTDCSIDGLNGEDIRVYSQKFIQDYFYEPDNLKGIFTLSKENKEAEEKIKSAQKEIDKLEVGKQTKISQKTEQEKSLSTKKQNAEKITWEIKTTFAGGDRVLEYCLENLKGKKDKLFNHLANINKPDEQPIKTSDQLKKEVEAIQGDDAQKHDLLSKINFTAHEVEQNQILQKNIVGNENSTVSTLINQLQNSDWVKDGLQYLPEPIGENAESCPFCQSKTITKSLFEDIQSFFDESYENDIDELKKLLSTYEKAISALPKKEKFEINPYIVEKKSEFENHYNAVYRLLEKNKSELETKIKAPSQEITLSDSAIAITKFNDFIDGLNKVISTHNSKIDNKDNTLADIKKQFWALMCWDYDQTISIYLKDKTDIEKKIGELKTAEQEAEKSISIQKDIIAEQQKNTINIEQSINFINDGLVELGLDDFHIEKHSDNLYKIKRSEQDADIFHSLSEGEKMIISFLYFVEMCRGKKSADDVGGKKIIVIDDPISSLSHIFIFTIGQLIKKEFLNSDSYEQVFILTHSLYFFYELTDTNHKRRKENQKLFRMTKNSDGSHICDMKYEEIQNDYQSYWQIIKDEKQPSALIANCMRNIIEYFFNFIEKKDLNNVFQKPELQDNKFQSFCRYVNREFHSLGQNIFDYKEFDYNIFKEALGLVFQESGYKEHYEEMIK